MFMTWQRSVGGHLKSDLSFSNTLVWNTFSVPELVASTRERITDVGKQVLEARALYPERSLADRYNPLAMSPELIKAMRIWIAGSTGRWGVKRQNVCFLSYRFPVLPPATAGKCSSNRDSWLAT